MPLLKQVTNGEWAEHLRTRDLRGVKKLSLSAALTLVLGHHLKDPRTVCKIRQCYKETAELDNTHGPLVGKEDVRTNAW